MASLTDFMVSRVRVKLLQIFLSQPQEIFYVRQLTRHTNEEINAVRRELARLQQKGMVKSEARGNRLYYYFNPAYPLYLDLMRLINKTSGLGGQILKFRQKLGKLKYAMLSGKYIRQLKRDSDEIDLLIVGTVVMPELANLVRSEEAKRNVEINYTVMTQEEFDFRKSRRDPFLTRILGSSRVMLIGDEEELIR